MYMYMQVCNDNVLTLLEHRYQTIDRYDKEQTSHLASLEDWWLAIIAIVLINTALLGKRPCIAFQGVNVAASIRMYGICFLGKRPCRPKSLVMFKCQWSLTRDTVVQ